MQTGACDAVITSSTSLISFRLEELCKAPDLGPRALLLVHARADHDVEAVSSGLPKDQQDLS